MGMKSPSFGEGLATALYYGTRFLNLVNLDKPKLSLTVSAPLAPQSIIRAGNNNLRFRRQQGWFSKT